MKRLPLKAKRIIRKKIFHINNITEDAGNWSRELDVKCRITNIVSENEGWDVKQTPLNPRGNRILVNVKVSGKATTCQSYSGSAYMRDISKVAEYKLSCGRWYEGNSDRIWGHNAHKMIREKLRDLLSDELKNYLKLLGIGCERHWQSIEVKNISWEK